MKSLTMVFGAAGVAALLAGCEPELAQVKYGEEEARWQETIRANYSGYRAPRTAPPAIVDNVSPRLLEEEQLMRENTPAVESAPAVASEDPSEADSALQSTPGEAAAPAAEAAPAVKAEAAAPAAEAAPAAKAEAAVPAGGETYVVQPGDSLGKIAKKFYGSANRYDVIVKANNALIKNPNRLRAGMKLVIPKI